MEGKPPPPLANNQAGSLKRLEGLVGRSKRNGQLEAYNSIIHEQLFRSAHFILHKWNSNARELELDHEVSDQSLTYAKQELGMKPGECGLLGLKWDKDCDTIGVEFSEELSVLTKKGSLVKSPRYMTPSGSPLQLPCTENNCIERLVMLSVPGRRSFLRNL